MNVVHVGPEVGAVGGMSSVIEELVAEGAGEATAVTSWSPSDKMRGWARLPRVIGRLWLLSRRSSPIVHVHLSERGSFLREGIVVVSARRFGMPVVATCHGAEFHTMAARWSRLVRFVLANTNHAIALDERTLGWLGRQGFSSSLMNNPVRVPEEVASGDGKTVVFAGVVGLRKGIDCLLKAWPAVKAKVPDAHLVVLGPADGSVPILSSPEGVSFLGGVSRTVVTQELERAAIAVLPSRDEILPMFLLEAMARGKPFVATPVGGVPRLLSSGAGFSVPVGDSAVLARTLCELLGDDEMRSRMGAVGHSTVLREYSRQAVWAAHLELYRKLDSCS